MAEIIATLGVGYCLALGTGILFAGTKGARYINKVFRRFAAWPVRLSGKSLLALARMIEG